MAESNGPGAPQRILKPITTALIPAAQSRPIAFIDIMGFKVAAIADCKAERLVRVCDMEGVELCLPVRLPAGSMVAVIPPETAEHIRKASLVPTCERV